MKHYFTKVVSLLVALMMIVNCVPATVLAEMAEAVVASDTTNDVPMMSTGNSNATKIIALMMGDDANGRPKLVSSSFSPYEPYETTNEEHPFLQGGSAWLDLSQIFYGAPATQNYPLAKWSANTSVYNVTGTGATYDCGCGTTYDIDGDGNCDKHPGDGENVYVLPDLDLIGQNLWANLSADHRLEVGTQNGTTYYENGVIGSTANAMTSTNLRYTVDSKNDEQAFAYNRYDAMQGKWGITLDKNVSSVTWTADWNKNYYGENQELNSSILHLTDTPYLYYSTEALDTTKMAISILIGTPVQSEYKTGGAGSLTQTNVTEKTYKDGVESSAENARPEYVYRWYTITDNAVRPGIETNTLGESMVPNVYVSDIVMENNLYDDASDLYKTLNYIANGYTAHGYYNGAEQDKAIEADINRLKPIELARAKSEELAESLFVSGSITGCIDFTQILPLLLSADIDADEGGDYREAVRYRIAQIRVDTMTNEDAESSAARINYLYFGPAMSTVYTPQSTVGNDVNAGNWQYAQNATNIGDIDPNKVAFNLHNSAYGTNSYDSGYVNGWENGQAVSITNTPNTPQLITIDTYGVNGGQITQPEVVDGVEQFAWSIENKDKRALWTYTILDENGNEKQVSLEAKNVGGTYYTMVTIPIRKWINAVEDARKLSFTLTMQRSVNGIKPNFCLWGNNDGAVGGGHSTTGTRFLNEDMLCVFGEDGYYQVDNADNFQSVLIDESVGRSVIYNGQTENEHYWHNESIGAYVYQGNFKLYRDDNGNTYYYCTKADDTEAKNGTPIVNVNTLYTAVQETVDDATGTWYEYVDIDDIDGDGSSHSTYIYNPTTGKMRTGGGTELETVLSLDLLKPLMVFTPSNVDINTLEVVYDSTETWIDMLRSPYMFGANEIIKSANATTGITEDMRGYVFVTALRIAVPVGTKMTIQNMKGDGNSAGLNMYSTSGAIVNAYDGGSGSQPELNVSNSLIERTAYLDTATKQYSTYQWDSRTISGTQSNQASAYGPYINGSNYTIYDMLDTEKINSNSLLSNAIGVPFEITGNYDTRTIYDMPYGAQQESGDPASFTGSDGSTVQAKRLGSIPKGSVVMVYGIVRFNSGSKTYSGATEEWGLIGANNQFAWIKTCYNGTYVVDQKGYTNVHFAFDRSYDGIKGSGSQYHYKDTTDELIKTLRNVWVFSKFGDSSLTGADLCSGSYRVPRLMGTITGAQNSIENVQCNKVSVSNSTDMTVSFNNTQDNGWRVVGMSRTFQDAIVLDIQSQGTNKTWPVLYYDYTQMDMNVHFGNVRLGIYVQKDSDSVQLYYLNGDGVLSKDSSGTALGTNCGYASLKNLMTENGYVLGAESNPTIRILGMGLYYTCNNKPLSASGDNTLAKTGTMKVRRFEIWQDTTPYLDEIITHTGATNNDNTTANAKVADGFNLINDAFYYTHNENADANNYPYTKQNSNKGWTGHVRTNSDKEENYRTSYYGYDYPQGVPGVFEYRTSLGHLRLWVGAQSITDLIFTADRSFNTKNYKYLYYSYSMRDVESGIAAEDQSAGGKGSGVTVAIKSRQDGSREAYLEQNDTWVYYNESTSYVDTSGNDNRTYRTSISAAVDLSTFDGISSINQLVFYFRNAENETAEFYLNYVYLSNVAPDALLAASMEEEQVQYYYLMDNTGDRYSARFPTIDNPTGQVSGINSDNDRVNPVIVTRGDRLSNGKYFNGDRLYGYGTLPTGENRVYDENSASVGYYEKLYGTTEADANAASNGSMKNILFYAGVSDDINDITDFYQYKDRNNDGKNEIYDMLWSYGRWYTGEGESGMNNMYVSKDTDGISGNLVRRYATENYVLLRSGIEPKKYKTYYDSKGGQMYFAGSNKEHTGAVMQYADSYYITETVILSYFTRPVDMASHEVVDPVKYGYKFGGWLGYIDEDNNNLALAKWRKKVKAQLDYFYADWIPLTAYTPTLTDGTYTWTDAAGTQYTWTDTNEDLTIDAGEFSGTASEWETKVVTEYYKDSKGTKQSKQVLRYVDQVSKHADYAKTATFNDPRNPGSVWLTREANYDNDFIVNIPDIIQMSVGGKVRQIVGWKVVKEGDKAVTDGAVYPIGAKMGVQDDVVFDPVYGDDVAGADMLVSITVGGGAHLRFLRGEAVDNLGNADFALTDANGFIKEEWLVDPATQNIAMSPTGDTTTYYIPRNLVCVLLPIMDEETDNYKEGNVWTCSYSSEIKGTTYFNDEAGAVLSTNPKYYQFSAQTNMTVTYATNPVDDEGNPYAYSAMYTSPETVVKEAVDETNVERTMTFYSQYDEAALNNKYGSGQVVATGVIYTRTGGNTDNYAKLSALEGGLKANMTLDESTITPATLETDIYTGVPSYKTKSQSYARFVQATKANKSGQFGTAFLENKGKAMQYYVRGYVIYQVGSEYKVEYSDIVATSSVSAIDLAN